MGSSGPSGENLDHILINVMQFSILLKEIVFMSLKLIFICIANFPLVISGKFESYKHEKPNLAQESMKVSTSAFIFFLDNAHGIREKLNISLKVVSLII